MNLRVKVALFVALSVVQLGAAAWSIARYESILATGTAYKIRVEPIDPADAFRGRYVAIQPTIFIATPIAPETEQLLQSVQSDTRTAYVRLMTDAEGFAAAAGIGSDAPRDGDYLKIEHAWPIWRPKPNQPNESEMTGYRLGFSFDRYYMNESAAPAAEQRYFEAARRNANTRAWLVVRVKDGLGVIEGLLIDGVAIEQLVRQ